MGYDGIIPFIQNITQKSFDMNTKIRFLFYLLFLITVQASAINFTIPNDSIGVTKLNGKIHVRYLVSPGETIYGISSKYRVPVSDLLELNPELENGLKVGQVVLIPYDAAALAAVKKNVPVSAEVTRENANEKKQDDKKDDKRIVHTVQSGETLYSLAKKYNVSVDDLMKWNNLDLRTGQEIVIALPSSVPEKQTGTAFNEKSVEKKPEAPVAATVPAKVARTEVIDTAHYDYDTTMQQVLIIPFDPYLYFSDADDEIAATSKINRTKVRDVFRRRMNALLDHPAYENIHLLGGKAQDSLTDLNKLYGSVKYNYQEILYNPNYKPKESAEMPQEKKTNKSWLEKQKEKLVPQESSGKATVAKDEGKYFGVIIKDPDFFTYYNKKYNTDYYIFVNQFEVKTNYENCLDRAAQNYERTFTTHYSIFDATGKQIAGNKFRTHYNSNSNNVSQIVNDNMKKITDRILADLPPPKRQ